jgi:DNA-binding protein YbaB
MNRIDLQAQIDRITAEMEETRANLTQAQERVAKISRTERSKNRAASVTVDAHGRVTGIEFHGTKYRAMAPAELADLLVTTIRAATAAAHGEVQATMNGLLPGTGLPPVLAKALGDAALPDGLLGSKGPFGDLASLLTPAAPSATRPGSRSGTPGTGTGGKASPGDQGWTGDRRSGGRASR